MKPTEFKNIPKQNTGFQIPVGYFEAFENQIMQQITPENKTSKNTVISLIYRKQFLMSSIAAVFVVAIAIPIYFNSTAKSSLESTETEHFLMQQQNICTIDIVPHLSDDDISDLAHSLNVSAAECDEIETYLSKNEHLEYILNN